MALWSWLIALLAGAVLAGTAAAQAPPPTVAEVVELADRADKAYSAGRYAEALELMRATRDAYAALQGAEHPNVLTAEVNMGAILLQLGRHDDALQALSAAERGWTRLRGPDDPMTLQAVMARASTLGQMGRHPEQLELNLRAVEGMTRAHGPTHLLTLHAKNNLAATYGWLGRLRERLALDREILLLREKAGGRDDPNTLVSMNNVAHTLFALGRHAESLSLDEEVLERRTRVLGERHPQRLTTLNNLARNYGQLGRHDQALAMQEEGLRLSREVHGESHPTTLMSMSNVAVSLEEAGRMVEGLALKSEVATRFESVMGGAHPRTLIAQGNLAYSLHAASRTPEALPLQQRVLEATRRSAGERHPSTLAARHNLLGMQSALARHELALPGYEQLLDDRRETLGRHHPDTLATLERYALALAAAGRPRDAAALAEAYVEGAEWQRAQPGLSGENRRSVFRRFAKGYRLFARLKGQAGQADAALRLAELGKARTMAEALAGIGAARSGLLPPAEHERLADLTREGAALDLIAAQARSPEARQQAEQARNALGRRWAELHDELARRFPRYAQALNVQVADAASIARALPADAVAVSYSFDGDELLALTVEPSGKVGARSLGRVPGLDGLVSLVQRSLAWSGTLKEVLAATSQALWRLPDGRIELRAAQLACEACTPIESTDAVLASLSQSLLAPLSELLRKYPRWILSPDESLAQLPFDALPFDGKEAVAATRRLQTAPSLTVYVLAHGLASGREAGEQPRAVLAVGHARHAGEPAPSPADGRRGVAVAARGLRLSDLDRLWTDLPHSGDEARAVAALFPGSRLLLREQATEARVRALDRSGELARFRYLLFAAHGFVSHSEPALSSIVLGAEGEGESGDGYLSAAEWPALTLRSQLVVLSACDTGVGRVVTGEGVMGLPYALFVAGNVNTLLTLWPVDDRATAVFVESLFRRMASGAKVADALADTRREFIRHARWSHPRYWAPFVLVGPG